MTASSPAPRPYIRTRNRLILLAIVLTTAMVEPVQAQPRFWACSADGGPMPLVEPSFFGVSSKEIHYDTEGRDDVAAAIGAAGLTWVGSKIHWERLEATQGVYDWSLYDPHLLGFAQAGRRPLVTLRSTPAWASPFPKAPRPGVYPPTNLAHWEAFVEAVVHHYGAHGENAIRHWEIWNEPNLDLYFAATPEAYVTLLNAAYDVIKREDPEAEVWGPAVAFHPWAPDAIDWVQHTIDHGRFDVLAVHLYFVDSRDTMPIFADLRRRLDEAGRQDTPIAITETNDIMTIIDCPGFSDRTQLDQAQQLVDDVACMARAGVETVFWFKSTDLGQTCPPPDDRRPNRNGLLDEHLEAKLAYHWYAAMAARTEPERVFFWGGFETDDTDAWSGVVSPAPVPDGTTGDRP